MSNPLDFWRGASPFFRDFGSIDRSINRLFEDWTGNRPSTEVKLFTPSCDLTESAKAYHLEFDLPGVAKEQIKIDLSENRLTVSGERKEEKKEEDKNKKLHLRETYYGSFMRSFSFPTAVDSERVEAKYENGVLKIDIPKLDKNGTRQITVK
ncbi:MAG: Hsp20/alpha crystallin family protein [Bacteriovoracia bacterium]